MRSLCIDVFDGFTYEELLPIAKKVGFDGFFSGEIWADHLEDMKHFSRLAKEVGLFQETSHSTIPGSENIWIEGNAGDEQVALWKRNIDNCAKLSVPILVIHGDPYHLPNPSFEIGIKRLEKVVAYAKEKGVKIAFENIYSPKFLYGILEHFQDDHVGFCYDCGHEASHTSGVHFLSQVGHRLLCTHFHDNDCINDLHRIPFDGSIDYIQICKELHDCGYTGCITLELCYNDYYRSICTKEEFIQRAFQAAKKLQDMLACNESL